MIFLENLDGIKLTRMCKEMSLPFYDVLKVENRLLDGSLHIQTLGDPMKIIKAEIVVYESFAELIDYSQNIYEELIFVKHDKRFRGFIRNPISWVKLGRYVNQNTLYTGNIEFVVLGEAL